MVYFHGCPVSKPSLTPISSEKVKVAFVQAGPYRAFGYKLHSKCSLPDMFIRRTNTSLCLCQKVEQYSVDSDYQHSSCMCVHVGRE